MKRRSFFGRILGAFGAAIVVDNVVAKNEITDIMGTQGMYCQTTTPTITPSICPSLSITPSTTPSVTNQYRNRPPYTSVTPSGDRCIDGKFIIGLD